MKSLPLALALGACQPKTPSPREPLGSPPGPRLITIDWSEAEAALTHPLSPDDQATLRLLSALKERAPELDSWVVPLIQRYLPDAHLNKIHLYIGYRLPRPIALGQAGAVFLDVNAPAWHSSGDRLWHALIRSLYRQKLSYFLPKMPADFVPADLEEWEAALLLKLEQDGLPAYVATRGQPSDLAVADFQALKERAKASERFLALSEALTSLPTSRAQLKQRWRELLKEDQDEQTFEIVGAFMAEAIERGSGQKALLEAIKHGPRAFFDAYQATRPGALVSFQLPTTTNREQTPPILTH